MFEDKTFLTTPPLSSALPNPQLPNPPLGLLAAFQRHYPTITPAWIVQAPGRETWVAAAPADESEGYILISAHADHVQARFNYRSAKFTRNLNNRPLPQWMRYAAGVIVALSDVSEPNFQVAGARMVTFTEGMYIPTRHDHALGMAVAVLWHEICGYPHTPEGIFELVEKVRRAF